MTELVVGKRYALTVRAGYTRKDGLVWKQRLANGDRRADWRELPAKVERVVVRDRLRQTWPPFADVLVVADLATPRRRRMLSAEDIVDATLEG